MKRIISIATIILGLTFVFGSINGLLIPLGYDAIIPVNPNSKFAMLLSQTNYIFVIQKLVELICGLCLLFGKYRFASLLALTPIVVCIFAYHIVDDIAGLPIALTVLTCYIISLLPYKKQVVELLKTN